MEKVITRYWQGKKLSKETRLKMSLARKGRKLTIEHKKKISLAHIGKKATEETRRNMSLAKLGRPSPRKGIPSGYKHTKAWKKATSERFKTLPRTEAWRRNIGRSHSGPKCTFWKGGISPENERVRKTIEYKIWRTEVFKRDNYQCVIGGKSHGTRLCADHIKSFSEYPELRFVVSNGRTLCEKCHRKTENFGWNIRHLRKKSHMKSNNKKIPEYAAFLKQARTASRFTAKKVSKECGVYPMTLYRWETGRCKPSLARFEKWLKVFGLKIIIGKI